ncbi:MAG: flagellar hook-basal body complex protein FliE [Helicobacteraceae bacterium]|nr:flagellar hook-basal body complex protein FliE [Helicobacteraceae bacterium]
MADITPISPISSDIITKKTDTLPKIEGEGFADQLKSALGEVNDMQIGKENAMADLATGQVKDLHQAALAIDKAELSMKLMLEVRGKALSAYQEISKTQM